MEQAYCFLCLSHSLSRLTSSRRRWDESSQAFVKGVNHILNHCAGQHTSKLP